MCWRELARGKMFTGGGRRKDWGRLTGGEVRRGEGGITSGGQGELKEESLVEGWEC